MTNERRRCTPGVCHGNVREVPPTDGLAASITGVSRGAIPAAERVEPGQTRADEIEGHPATVASGLPRPCDRPFALDGDSPAGSPADR
jgi:hypothetical protein